MKEFNSYLTNLDYSRVKSLFMEKGELRTYRKKDFFIRQNEASRLIGWVQEGTFQYTYTDKEGKEHIVGYSFPHEFVCDYSTLLQGGLSLVNIQAITKCTLYELPGQSLVEFWETDMDTQRLGRHAAENLFELVYKRLLDTYCSPEMRYRELIGRYPALKETVPLKSIASFLGVTPETISHIRKKILAGRKS